MTVIIPSNVLDDVYSLLVSYDQKPKMEKDLFVNWLSQGYVFKYSTELNGLLFSCKKPFTLYVYKNKETIPIEQINQLNNELSKISIRAFNMSLFW